ncbi:glycosyltransferase family 39 protein [Candidatus Collierbacteria bacterium]|nr:glycosyltransferase family 39 protein [Candidatus Collierbacteria bacterium]
MKSDKTMNFLTIAFITFISFILFFFRLGNTALTNWDEAWFGSVAQNMAESGNILAGKWNGQIFFYEPPLLVWLLKATIKLFGESEFWLRSVSAISGVFTVIGCYILAKQISKSKLAGILASLVILSDIEILFRSRQINVEILLTVLLLWSIIFAVKAYEAKKIIWIISSAICLGLAFLTKRASPLLALPAIGYLFFSSLTREAGSRSAGRVPLFIFFITFTIVISPWYLLSYLKWGDQFINEFFIGYTFNKIKSVNASVGTSPFFYLNSLKHAFKLWTLLIPLAAVWGTLKAFRDRKIAGLMIFILTFLILLTAAPIKSSWFLLPIHPIIAVILGIFLYSCLKRPGLASQGRALLNKYLVFAGLSLIFVIATYQLYHYRRDYIVPDTTNNQAVISRLAGSLSENGKSIYLDDEYLPVAVFYSRKNVIPLRFSRTENRIPSLVDIPEGSLVLTNLGTYPVLKSATGIIFEDMFAVGDMLLVRSLGIRI